jgi:hypothetical protein
MAILLFTLLKGNNPSLYFHNNAYFAMYPDVKESEMNECIITL